MTRQQPANRLHGKTALVTGSTRGLGRATAEWLAREGASVVIHGRREEEVLKVPREISQENNVESFGIRAELSEPDEAHRLAEETLARVEQLDILVNNAGRSIVEDVWTVSDRNYEYQMNLNTRTPFILSQHAARHMMEREIRGRIVSISTIGVFRVHGDRAVYNMGKAALQMMTTAMAYELAPYGISVNCVAPGAMAQRPGAPENQEAWEKAAEFIPFGRVGTGDDIASAVTWLCLPESEFTTGQTILISGGHESYLRENR
jgi:NAD(P)-dependent dehydrogenase (short-subunit alcohol dehydrogenase family)